MSAGKFQSAAIRYTRLAEEATTETVRRHLLMLARHYETLATAPKVTRREVAGLSPDR